MHAPAPLRHRQLIWLVVAIAVAGAGLLSVPWAWVESVEQHTIDFRFLARHVLRGAAGREARSVIVGVADSSLSLADSAPKEVSREPLAAMTQPWPWNRRVFAAVVRKLRASGARAIVCDIVFDAANPGDAEFARALAEPGAPVVLASLLQSDVTGIGEVRVKVLEPAETLRVAAGGRVGYGNVFPDFDGVLRRVTTTLRPSAFAGQAPVGGEIPLPSLALAAVQATQPAGRHEPGGGLIDYLGPTGTIPAIPVEDLFLPDRWNNAQLRGGQFFRDRVVWLGALSEVQFKDDRVTPFGVMAGVEAQAQAFETLAGTGPLAAPSFAGTMAWVWAFALAGVGVAGAALRVSHQLALVAGGAAAWGGLALGLFAGWGVVLPCFAPATAWLVAGGGGVGVRFIREQRERHRLRGVLGRYVSEEVARIIVDQPDEFSQALRGGRRAVTVLFADLRGFTTWVEKAEPEAFVAQLNEYFGAVVDCVLAQGGTLQKFIGDAVLAVWGDTRTAGAALDTARAVDAALAMQAAVTRLNATWAERPDRTPMAIGIGLHHGMAMVGNVGHAQRMEFTVLGDVVNVAARLESANRQLGTTVLVSEAVRDLVADTHRCVPLGRFGVKGRREAVGLFVPLGGAAAAAPAWFAGAEEAFAAWTRGDFATAGVAYAALARQPAPLAEFFQQQAERARRLAVAPPADWKGEYPLESK